MHTQNISYSGSPYFPMDVDTDSFLPHKTEQRQELSKKTKTIKKVHQLHQEKSQELFMRKEKIASQSFLESFFEGDSEETLQKKIANSTEGFFGQQIQKEAPQIEEKKTRSLTETTPKYPLEPNQIVGTEKDLEKKLQFDRETLATRVSSEVKKTEDIQQDHSYPTIIASIVKRIGTQGTHTDSKPFFQCYGTLKTKGKEVLYGNYTESWGTQAPSAKESLYHHCFKTNISLKQKNSITKKLSESSDPIDISFLQEKKRYFEPILQISAYENKIVVKKEKNTYTLLPEDPQVIPRLFNC